MRPTLQALLLTLALPVSFAEAHFPAVFGRDYALPESPAAPASPGPGGERKPLARLDEDALDAHRRALERAELADGPFAPRLSEPLTALALLYRDAGRYREAEALYRRALHVERVNGGLLGGGQLPLVDALLSMYREQGNVLKLDDLQDYRFRLYGSGMPPFTAERRAAGLAYLRWQREALALEIDGSNRGRLVHLHAVNQRMLDALEADGPEDSRFHLELVMSQVHNLYLIMGELPVEEQPGAGNLLGQGSPAKFGSEDAARQRLGYLQLTGVARGRELLQDFLDRWPALDPSVRTAVRLELADWLQWNEHYGDAKEEYRAVVRELMRRGDTGRYQSLFALPVELPAGNRFWPEPEHLEDRPPVDLSASFRVSARGNVSDIEVTPAEGSAQGREHRLVRLLRESHFRPRISPEGEREASVVQRRYRLYR